MRVFWLGLLNSLILLITFKVTSIEPALTNPLHWGLSFMTCLLLLQTERMLKGKTDETEDSNDS